MLKKIWLKKMSFSVVGCVLGFGCGLSDSSVSHVSNFSLQGSASSTAVAAFFKEKKIDRALNRLNKIFLPNALASFSGSPLSLKLKVYAFYVSSRTDCTSPIEVENYGTTPREIDFYDSPQLFSAYITPGTYPCLIIKMSDHIKYKPDSTAVASFPGVCSSTTEVIRDLYRAPDTDLRDMNGVSIVATGSHASPSEDIIYSYASTDTSALTNAPINMSSNQIVPMSGALTVPSSLVFYADFENGIEGNVGSPLTCNLEGGTGFGFR